MSNLFRNLGEQLLAVREHAITGVVDQRLEELQKRATIAPAGGSEMVPSDGGFLVEPDFARNILERVYDTGDILSRCLDIPITRGNSVSFPQFDESSRVNGSRLGGIQVYMENEAQNIQIPAGTSSQKPTFQKTTLTAKKITGLLYLTNELADDSDAMNSWASYAFTQELNFKLEGQIVGGSGVGGPLGILKSPALITVPKEAGQQNGTIVGQNVINMMSSLWAPSWRNAVWLFNQQALPSLLKLTVFVQDGGSQANLWQSSLADGEPNRLCGIPAYPSEHCQNPGTTGDLILSDFSRYAVGTRERRYEASIHVLFLSDQNAFRFILRVDGQPVDNRPITPLHAASTSPAFQVSPFVALATR